MSLPTAILRRFSELDKRLSGQFQGLNNFPYHLYAVFIHRGSATAGHYWIYIFDFEKGIWREYNDEQVLEVQNISTIFAPQTGSHSPSPYFLVYVSETTKQQLTQPVYRKVCTTSFSGTPQVEERRASRPTAHKPATGSVLAQEVLPEDLDDRDMPDAPPAYEDVVVPTNIEGTGNAHPIVQDKITPGSNISAAPPSSPPTFLEPARGGKWASDVADIPGVGW